MPGLLPIESSHPAPALLALRRTLWQLAILGAASATAIVALADAPGMLPAWMILLPISALLVHHRDAVLGLIRIVTTDERRAISQRRRPVSRQASRRSEPMSRRRLPRPALPAQHVR